MIATLFASRLISRAVGIINCPANISEAARPTSSSMPLMNVPAATELSDSAPCDARTRAAVSSCTSAIAPERRMYCFVCDGVTRPISRESVVSFTFCNKSPARASSTPFFTSCLRNAL